MGNNRKRSRGLWLVAGVALLILAALFVGRTTTPRPPQPSPTSPGHAAPAPASSRAPPPSTLADPSQPPQVERDPAATVLVSGTVVDSLGGPIEAAWIGAHTRPDRGPPVALGLSDEHGRFTLWVRPGPVPDHAARLWLSAQAQGYAETTVIVYPPTRTATIALFAESLLAGTVETEAGELVPGVTVQLRPPPLSVLPRWPQAQTDASGRFEIHGLAPGRYLPVVDDGRWFVHGKAKDAVELGFLERRNDLRIVVASGHHVRVDVRSFDGAACPTAHAYLVGLDRRVPARPDEDGFMSIAGVPSGEHRLVAGCPGSIGVEQAIEVHADQVFEITTTAGLGIQGRVLDDRGDPVAGATIHADRPRLGLAHDTNTAQTDDEGRFELTGLAPASLLVHASRSDRISPAPVEVELQPGDSPPFIELTLGWGECLTGRVDGGPDQLLIIAGPADREPSTTRLGPAGEFEICGFQPGTKARLVLEDGGTRTPIPFIVEQRPVSEHTVHIPKSTDPAPLALRIEATPNRVLQLHLESESAPVRDAVVRLLPDPKGEFTRCGRPWPIMVIHHSLSDTDGNLSFEKLWPTRYFIHAEHDGAMACATVDLSDESTMETVTLNLEQ